MRLCRLAFIGLLLLAALPIDLSAQQPPQQQASNRNDIPAITRTYAITNARIVVAPGQEIPRGTVVLRNGVIEAVGPDVPVPTDAWVLEGDLLVVYAGFIDGLSHTGVPAPRRDENQQEERRRVQNPGDPPPELAGLTPERDVRMLLKPDDASVEKLRRVGFTMAHVVPRGRMLPGQGALIFLRGQTPAEMVYRGEVSLFAQLEPAQGVYPATDMAVLARFRQLYREAARRRQHTTLYASDPRGLEPPPYDPVHAAFFPVLEKRQPVFFYTEDALDIHRVLALQQQLDFPLRLAGLAQSFDVLEKLKQANIPLFLTLDLPETPKDTSKLGKLSDDSLAARHHTYLHVSSYRDVSVEIENLKARQAKERIKYYKTAALLHEAGLRFGFSTRDADPDKILRNLRTMIKYGLPEEAALAALTIDAARLLGIDRAVGTVEAGKLANLVVTTGPLFDEKTRIRYVFVAGELFEIKEPARRPRAHEEGATPARADGTWSCTVDSPEGSLDTTLRIEGQSGTLSSSAIPQELPLENLTLEGSQLSFSVTTNAYGRVNARLTLSGNAAEGTIDVPGVGALPMRCTRTSGPER
ncbi:amidohydrolase family protein [Rhodothermus marinus]|uniref:amidohydrolase family protein n=1 Tax=Rhodothermus marinus TaxID=29549 RepID=UPI0006CF28B5|nr:amidohydrolase family protein [Rhodothermus marinus]